MTRALRFEEGLQIYDDAIERAEESLIEMGLPLPPRPSDRHGNLLDMPYLPEDLQDMSPRELGDLLVTFSRWFEYASGQLKKFRGRRNVCEKKRAWAWSEIRKKKTGTVSDKDDETRTDIRYVNVDAEFECEDHKHGLLDGIVRGLERNTETISRNITVMDQRLGVEGRTAAISKKRRDPKEEENKFKSRLDKFRKRTR